MTSGLGDLRLWRKADGRLDPEFLEAQQKQGAPGHGPWDVKPTLIAGRGPDVSWQDEAACRGMDVLLFFGPDGEPRPERQIREAKAKAVCASCPVQAQCLDYALGNSIMYGIWGGLNEEERARERRRAPRPDAA